jgi:LysM repeat protein
MEAEHRSPLRVFAPAAVVVFGLVLILVIATSGGSSGSSSSSPTKLERQDLGAKKTARSRRHSGGALPQGIYIVKRNDTFGSIAGKTGIAVSKLQELNPNVDPQTLHEGEKIKLR